MDNDEQRDYQEEQYNRRLLKGDGEPLFCTMCGQLHSEAVTQELWSIWGRLPEGIAKSHYEPLVFTSDWLQENIHDEDDMAAINNAMEKDMHNRGLCTKCGRPNLQGINPDEVMTEQDARELDEMHAEAEAERRAGC